MEIKEYLQILKRNLLFLTLILVVFVGVAWTMTEIKATNYRGSSAFEIIRVPSLKQSDVSYFQFDNFYASQVASSVSDNMIGWLASASTVSDIYQRAGYDVPDTSLKALSSTFTATKKKDTAAVVDISYSSTDKEKATRLIKSATETLKSKVSNYNEVDSSAVLITKSSDPVVIPEPKATMVNSLIAGFIGLVVALGLISIREALKK
jgi:capsular polysaccharide biosynthesis protein